MSQYIIIRGKVNSGKTSACGMLYKELKEDATVSYLLSSNLKQKHTKLRRGRTGNIIDFVSIHVYKGKVIVIISAGDVAEKLKEALEKLSNSKTMENLVGIPYKVDIFIVCARSQMRKNSTLEMLHNKIPEERRQEVLTKSFDDESHQKEDRHRVVKEVFELIRVVA